MRLDRAAVVRVANRIGRVGERGWDAVFRLIVDVPQDWAGQLLQLNFEAVDDFEAAFWNGVEIGATDKNTPEWCAAKRV